MQFIDQKDLAQYCISKRYDEVKNRIIRKYGADHYLIDDLVQEGAIAYQNWLSKIDTTKLPHVFNSCMKKAYWACADHIKWHARRDRMSGGQDAYEGQYEADMIKHNIEQNSGNKVNQVDTLINSVLRDVAIQNPKQSEMLYKIYLDPDFAPKKGQRLDYHRAQAKLHFKDALEHHM